MVVDSLFIVAFIVCGGSVFGPCFLFSTLCPTSVSITWMRETDRQTDRQKES